VKIRLQRARSVAPLKNRFLFKRLLREVLTMCGFSLAAPGVLQINLLSEAEMTSLNALHLGHQGLTDVITYDLRTTNLLFPGEEAPVLAEIYLCPKVAERAAGLYGQSPSRELFLYAVHGLLHLQGEDDLDDKARTSMRSAENRVMQAFGKRLDNLEFF